ncbi:MAG: serine hydrolase, partial [Verrucomicrobiaceae bacterium]
VSRESLKSCSCGTAQNKAFSHGFWNNSEAGGNRAQEVNVENMLEEKWPKQHWRNACLQRHAPGDLIASIGSGSQRLYVVPSHDLVVVRQGRNSQFTDAEFLRLLFGA